VNDFIEEMIDLKKMTNNPLIGLRKYNKNPEKPRGVIDRDSLEKMFPPHHAQLIRIWGSSMWACFMLMIYDTGARPGEVRALTWGDINLEKRFVPIRKSIESGTSDTIKGTKTGVIKAGFLNNRTVQELNILRMESKWNSDEDFIFTLNGKKPIINTSAIYIFRRGLMQIENDNEGWKANPAWTPYWVRHSFGTYQMENLDEAEISALMGTGVVVLKRHYQHPDDETLYRSSEPIKEKLDKARNITSIN